jgi:serine-type D-Ala-D-Ala carboxypeptidase/endopeptidase (penicillin-binding protein 4)
MKLGPRVHLFRFFMLAAAVCAFTSAVAAQTPAAGTTHSKSAAAKTAPVASRKDVAQFASRVQSALSESHAAKASWGILVLDRDTGEALYESNADRFFTPASNAKVFTTSLALAELGTDFRFRTTLESAAQISSDGKLAGDLRLVGRGDPDLSNRKFPFAGKVERDGPVEKILAEMADEAVAKGLREIDGDVVADDSYYPYDPYPPGWAIGDVFFTFGSPIGALALNDNCITVTIAPGAKVGDPANVSVEPAAALDTFSRRVVTVEASAKPEV